MKSMYSILAIFLFIAIVVAPMFAFAEDGSNGDIREKMDEKRQALKDAKDAAESARKALMEERKQAMDAARAKLTALREEFAMKMKTIRAEHQKAIDAVLKIKRDEISDDVKKGGRKIGYAFFVAHGILKNPDANATSASDDREEKGVRSRIFCGAVWEKKMNTTENDVTDTLCTTAYATSCFQVRKACMIAIGSEKYALKSINLSSGVFTASIMENGTEIGKVSLEKVLNSNRAQAHWKGMVSLESTSWVGLYKVQQHRLQPVQVRNVLEDKSDARDESDDVNDDRLTGEDDDEAETSTTLATTTTTENATTSST